MPAKKSQRPAKKPSQPTIHEATLGSGTSGAVLKGAELDLAAAILRRRAGLDIVVCGDDLAANRRLARQIESAVANPVQQAPHKKAGPAALPHFQPDTRPPEGHSFRS